MNYTYILRLNDGSLNTGWTNDLNKRIKAHNSGNGAKCTRAKLPAVLVYYEEYLEKSDAMKREFQIKKMKKKDKEELISSKDFNPTSSDFNM